MGFVESQIADPGSLDEETLVALIEQYAPGAIDVALAWASTVDPSVIPVPQDGVVVDFTCQEPPYLCDQKTTCPYEGAKIGCFVSHCGSGKCPSSVRRPESPPGHRRSDCCPPRNRQDHRRAPSMVMSFPTLLASNVLGAVVEFPKTT